MGAEAPGPDEIHEAAELAGADVAVPEEVERRLGEGGDDADEAVNCYVLEAIVPSEGLGEDELARILADVSRVRGVASVRSSLGPQPELVG